MEQKKKLVTVMARNKDQVKHALSLLEKVATQQEQEVQKFITDHPLHISKDEEDRKCLVLDFFQRTEGSPAIFWMANFTCREFQKIYDKFVSQINSN